MSTPIFKSKLRALKKRILQFPWCQKVFVWFLYGYLYFVNTTTRWKVIGQENLEGLLKHPDGFIVCFWHNRIAMMSFLWGFPRSFFMLISSHKDGQLISRVVAKFGIQTISGSTNRGGSFALKKLISLLKNKEVVGLTPDGPRGPQYSISEGIVHLSRLTQKPIICATYNVSRFKTLNTWDRFIVPLPFGKGVKVWGEVLSPPALSCKEEEIVHFIQQLSEAMHRCTRKGERALQGLS